jgi:hypothetical protein
MTGRPRGGCRGPRAPREGPDPRRCGPRGRCARGGLEARGALQSAGLPAWAVRPNLLRRQRPGYGRPGKPASSAAGSGGDAVAEAQASWAVARLSRRRSDAACKGSRGFDPGPRRSRGPRRPGADASSADRGGGWRASGFGVEDVVAAELCEPSTATRSLSGCSGRGRVDVTQEEARLAHCPGPTPQAEMDPVGSASFATASKLRQQSRWTWSSTFGMCWKRSAASAGGSMVIARGAPEGWR